MDIKEKAVLIVDDVKLNRTVLCELFDQDYKVIEAENGKQALNLIERYHNDILVVLLDVVMPIMDGFGVLNAMRSKGWLRYIPVIMITAQSGESAVLRGYDHGVCDFIHKPFNTAVVRRRVDNAIELYAHKLHLENMVYQQTQVLERQAKRLKQINMFIIDTFSTIAEFRNCESGLHIKRIRGITKILMEEFSRECPQYFFAPEAIEAISCAAAMHDIGKIAIPDRILTKPGKLTKEEFEIMKTHTDRGCEILKTLNYVQNEAYYAYCHEICRHHHERWDGRGYPDGLIGDETPIWVQAVSLADVYEALISMRVYKPAFSHQKAVSMIINGECGAFNPSLITCFLHVADRLHERIMIEEL